MSWFREQFYDLKDRLSPSNTKSRGFYIFLTVSFILAYLLGAVLLVLSIISLVQGTVKIFGLVFLPGVFVFMLLLMWLLSRNE